MPVRIHSICIRGSIDFLHFEATNHRRRIISAELVTSYGGTVSVQYQYQHSPNRAGTISIIWIMLLQCSLVVSTYLLFFSCGCLLFANPLPRALPPRSCPSTPTSCSPAAGFTPSQTWKSWGRHGHFVLFHLESLSYLTSPLTSSPHLTSSPLSLPSLHFICSQLKYVVMT